MGPIGLKPVNDGIGLAGEMRLRAELSGGLASMSPPNRPAKPVAKWLQELRIPRGGGRIFLYSLLKMTLSGCCRSRLTASAPLRRVCKTRVLHPFGSFLTAIELSPAGLPVRLIVHRRDVPERRQNRRPGCFSLWWNP